MRLARRRSATTVLAVLAPGLLRDPRHRGRSDRAARPPPRASRAARTAPAAAPPAGEQDTAGLRPGIHWEEAQAHANDKLDLPAGGRVSVGFSPRSDDRWTVAGAAPRALPAGRRSGRELRDAMKQQHAAPTPASPRPPPTPAPAAEPTPAPTEAPPSPTPEPATEPDPATPAPTDTPVDQPVIDESDVIPAEPASWTSGTATAEATVQPAAVITQIGLRREVFGFLPYWELSDSSTTLDYAAISTIAYFGVGASATGTLIEDTRRLDRLDERGAHQPHQRGPPEPHPGRADRAELRLVGGRLHQAEGAPRQRTARARLAINIAEAIRDRGADGVNLDFEPLASGYADEFVLLLKRVRAELDAMSRATS